MWEDQPAPSRPPPCCSINLAAAAFLTHLSGARRPGDRMRLRGPVALRGRGRARRHDAAAVELGPMCLFPQREPLLSVLEAAGDKEQGLRERVPACAHVWGPKGAPASCDSPVAPPRTWEVASLPIFSAGAESSSRPTCSTRGVQRPGRWALSEAGSTGASLLPDDEPSGGDRGLPGGSSQGAVFTPRTEAALL